MPINSFDRGKPFYPLIMSYIIQLLGLKEILVRGVIGARKIMSEDVAETKPPNTLDEQISEAINGIEQLIGPLKLRSEFTGSHISVDADEFARELVQNHAYLLPYYIRAAGSLLVLAHEITKNQPYRDKGPLWEFLRHCRNGATHNGLFHFCKGEPSRAAEWGTFKIEVSLQGSPLFNDGTKKGLLSLGDPIRLLWDIEKTYPHIISESA